MSTGFKITMAVIISVVVLFAYSVWKQPTTITVDMSVIPDGDRELAATGVQQLFTTCAGLTKYKPDIERVKASLVRIDPDLIYDPWAIHERYGWQEWVEIEIEIADDTSTPRNWFVEGHHLFYSVGPSGIVVNKDVGGHFCGLGYNSGFLASN